MSESLAQVRIDESNLIRCGMNESWEETKKIGRYIMNDWENCDVFFPADHSSPILRPSFPLPLRALPFFGGSHWYHHRRRWCSDHPFALRSKWVLKAIRNRLASAIAAGKYFGPFQLENKTKRKRAEDLVVIRTVSPHARGKYPPLAVHFILSFAIWISLSLLQPCLTAVFRHSKVSSRYIPSDPWDSIISRQKSHKVELMLRRRHIHETNCVISITCNLSGFLL